MVQWKSRLDTGSADFAKNREEMLAMVKEIRSLEAKVRARGAKKRKRFEKRGQLLPRERVARLLDPGSPFLELSALAGYKMHDDDGDEEIAGGGTIIGIGMVSGIRCLITCSDSAIKGGSVTPMGLKKSLRAQEVALKEKLPTINMVESGGANLLYQSEIFVEGGRVFANMARMSAAGVPQIAVVHGSSTAGGAYLPGLSDYVIAVKEKARIFLAGPPLVKAALGEDSTEEELGGAHMHATVSGTAEYLAEDDAHAVHLARQVLASIGWDGGTGGEKSGLPPVYDPEELCGLVPVDTRQPYDVKEIVARLVDESEFLEFKALYGSGTFCGHAKIDGQAVGILGNNGPIFPEGSVKAAQFIQLCCQTGTPLVFLMNTTGYMVGKEAEQRGAIKHGSKMIQAVANATVPKVTIVLGGAYGAGNYGMSGRGYDPNFIFSWPNAKVAVMGGSQAAKVMEIITQAKAKRMGFPMDDDMLEAMTGGVRDQLNAEAVALFGTARIWDDGIIDPRDTRKILSFCLKTSMEAKQKALRSSTFGVARG